MNDFIYNIRFIYKNVMWWGWEKKIPKYTKDKTKEKIPRLVALPSPRYTKWSPTVFRCPKTPKTSRTYRKWERVPNLMGQKKIGWVRYGQLMLGDGDGRKKSRNIQKTKQRKKFPVWLPSHPPVIRSGVQLFSGVRKHRKQAEPTLSGSGFLI